MTKLYCTECKKDIHHICIPKHVALVKEGIKLQKEYYACFACGNIYKDPEQQTLNGVLHK